jgi:hypothetical protein
MRVSCTSGSESPVGNAVRPTQCMSGVPDHERSPFSWVPRTAGTLRHFGTSRAGLEPDLRASESRPLTQLERRLLNSLLALDFQGTDALRLQADTVRAFSSFPCGCGSIGFERPDLRGVTAPPNPVVHNENGGDVGGLILFLSDGLLQDLRYSFDPEPLPLPEAEFVRFMPFE